MTPITTAPCGHLVCERETSCLLRLSCDGAERLHGPECKNAPIYYVVLTNVWRSFACAAHLLEQLDSAMDLAGNLGAWDTPAQLSPIGR